MFISKEVSSWSPIDSIPWLRDFNGVRPRRDFPERVLPVPEERVGVSADDHVEPLHLPRDLGVLAEAGVPHRDEDVDALAPQPPRLRPQRLYLAHEHDPARARKVLWSSNYSVIHR